MNGSSYYVHNRSSKPMLSARKSAVGISKVELDHMIDCIDRNVATGEHCSHFAKQAMGVFDTSAKALKGCKHTFERFKRS